MTRTLALHPLITRRHVLWAAALGAGGLALGRTGRSPVWAQGPAPAVITRDARRPQTPSGVMTGDVTADRAVVWSRTDRPARLLVEYATTEAFQQVRRVGGPPRSRTATSPRASISRDSRRARTFFIGCCSRILRTTRRRARR